MIIFIIMMVIIKSIIMFYRTQSRYGPRRGRIALYTLHCESSALVSSFVSFWDISFTVRGCSGSNKGARDYIVHYRLLCLCIGSLAWLKWTPPWGRAVHRCCSKHQPPQRTHLIDIPSFLPIFNSKLELCDCFLQRIHHSCFDHSFAFPLISLFGSIGQWKSMTIMRNPFM